MSFGIKLRVFADYACFTRPEMKVERVSYEVITPSAARAVLEAIYWKPAIKWIIDKIHIRKVYKAINGKRYIINDGINYMNIRRNELGIVVSVDQKHVAGIKPLPSQVIEENRQQRAAIILKDVEYVIEAHFEETGKEKSNIGKHLDMFNRRARNGQCFKQPYLGCREYTCGFELIETELDLADNINISKDLGYMLYDIDFSNSYSPMFFNATLENGTVIIPHPDSREVLR